MRQRVKLAQALVHSPELVVLDEPTNGLDPQGRDEMLELVRRLSRDLGIRVLFSSHVLEDVERTCDAVVVLREGRVAAQGRISDLRGREAGSARHQRRRRPRRAARRARSHAACGVEDGEDGWLAVHGDPGVLPDAVRDACAEADVSLRALLPGDRTLEDAVIGAIA